MKMTMVIKAPNGQEVTINLEDATPEQILSATHSALIAASTEIRAAAPAATVPQQKRNVWGVDRWAVLVDCPACMSMYDAEITNPKYPHICRNQACKQPLRVSEIRNYKGRKAYTGPIYEAIKKF